MLFFIILCLFVAACAQLTPVLIGRDVWMPRSIPCIRNGVNDTGGCDIYRSDGCNSTTYRCILSGTLSDNNTLGQLITFSVITYAAIFPTTTDGAIRVNLRYFNLRFWQLSGIIQLWRKTTGNLYEFYDRQTEVNYEVNVNDQTYYIHGLRAGVYVVVYWDDGGTRGALGNPEISQPITVPSVFNQEINVGLRAMPIDNENSGYKRLNRNYISYELYGPVGLTTVLTNACTDPTKNRCIAWEYRSDQGNIINVKTELETNVAPGFVDTMFKFKMFPTMCCKRRSIITARLVYRGAYPLFPTDYEDYWLQPQNYGHGTDIAYKVLQLSRVYMDDPEYFTTQPASTPVPAGITCPSVCGILGCSICNAHLDYQRYTSLYYGTANQAVFPPCHDGARQRNEIVHVGSTHDIFVVYTLHRKYCECLLSVINTVAGDRQVHTTCSTMLEPGGSGNPQKNVPWPSNAWRSGLGQDTNNYDRYEDYKTLLDIGTDATTKERVEGHTYGRTYAHEIDFADHSNTNDALDYACAPANTFYTDVSNFMSHLRPGDSWDSLSDRWSGQQTGGVYADLQIEKTEIRDFYGATANVNADPCQFYGYGGEPTQCGNPDIVTSPFFFFTDGYAPESQSGFFRTYQLSTCNCLSRVGFHDTRDSMQMDNMWSDWSDASEPIDCQNNFDKFNPYGLYKRCYKEVREVTVWEWIHNHANFLNWQMCCNAGTKTGDNYNYVEKWRFEVHGMEDMDMTTFQETDWKANGVPIFFQTDNDNAVPNGIQTFFPLPSGGGSTSNVIGPITPDNIIDKNWCQNTPSRKCINRIAKGSNWHMRINRERTEYMSGSYQDITPVYQSTAASASTGYEFYYTPDGNVSNVVFGVYGRHTFPVMYDTSNRFSRNGYATGDQVFGAIPASDNQEMHSVRQIQPTYARFKVVPTIDFYSFETIIWGPAATYTIDVRFRIHCPNMNLVPEDDNILGHVGYCAQNWLITNQYNHHIYVGVVRGPTTVSEPQTGLPSPFLPSALLPDVLRSEEFVIRIKYYQGNRLVWRFFMKTEPEQPVGNNFCGYSGNSPMAYDPGLYVPDHAKRIMTMVADVVSIPPACEYKEPEMRAIAFRGSEFVYAVCPRRNLPSYEVTGFPLDYGRCTNYWFKWTIGGKKLEGFSVRNQPYEAGSTLLVYDRATVLGPFNVPAPITIPVYPNPLLRDTSCQNFNATCFTPNDDTNKTGYTHIDQNHYCGLDNKNAIILTPALVFVPPFTYANNVGAIYCNRTTEYINVLIQELQTKALYGLILECNVTETGHYTYTIRYGIADNFLCYERMITYAIVLTSFQASPGALFRIPGCNRADNCCYQLPINVFGNTGNTEDIVNLNTCNNGTGALPECMYEIVTTPPPSNDSYAGLCLGQTYTFVVRSPAAMVQNREQATIGNTFQYPWRCQTSFVVTLPTLGFAPIDTRVTNNDCAVGGSSLEFSTTVTDPICANQILPTNSNPACQYKLVFAIEPITVPSGYSEPQASLVSPFNPFWLQGASTKTYNSEFFVTFPEILGLTGITSLPDGVYNLYIWLSPGAGAIVSYNTAALDPRKAIQTRVVVQFNDENGLKIILNSIIYPRCPATFDDVLATPIQNISKISIAVSFTIRDADYNGPYNLTFMTPSLQLIKNYTIDTVEACCATCGGFCNSSCPACDIYVRDRGLPHVFNVGTGVVSPGEEGLFFILVKSFVTGCTATFFPFITAMDTLVTQVTCQSPTCVGKQNGIVYSTVRGGTKIPMPLTSLIQNSDLTSGTARYYYNWTGDFSPFTNLTRSYLNQSHLPFMTSGNFTLYATDFNGCRVNASCQLRPRVPPIELEILGASPPNCSDTQGVIVFAVKNGTGTPPFTLYRVSPNAQPVQTSNGYILADTSMLAGVESLYMACDVGGCCSQMVNFSTEAPASSQVSLRIVRYACSSFVTSGILEAIVTPNPFGVTFVWFLNGNLIPFVNVGTLNGVGSGIYQVVITDPSGCTNSASMAVTTAENLALTFQRTSVTIDPGIVQGIIFGGNGPPYQVSIRPQEDADKVIITVTQANPLMNETFTSFTIHQVPPQASIFIDVKDAGGCIVTKFSQGGKLTATDVVISPSFTPVPHVDVEPRPVSFNYLYIILSIIASLSALMIIFFIWTCERRRKVARYPPLLQ